MTSPTTAVTGAGIGGLTSSKMLDDYADAFGLRDHIEFANGTP